MYKVTGCSLISIHYVGEHYVAKLGLGRKSIQELYIYVCLSLNLWSRNIVQGHTTVLGTTLSWEERNMVCSGQIILDRDCHYKKPAKKDP